MMQIKVTAPAQIYTTIQLPSSKSISNRALIINALGNRTFQLENLSDCDDTQVMIHALNDGKNTIDIMAAGTAMRFLTAYLSVTPGTRIITGTQRMQQRPIQVLVNALRELGAEIEYIINDGYPPLRITGHKLQKDTISLPGNISSQYISALLMIAPILSNGLALTLTGEIISRPYINLTLQLMNDFGAKAKWLNEYQLKVEPQPYQSIPFYVESDWSAASYWYQIAALSNKAEIILPGLFAILSYFTRPKNENGEKPMFPIEAAGSVLFGAWLVIMPEFFVNILMYLLGALLVIAGVQQLVSLISARKWSNVPLGFYLMPALILITGVMILAYPFGAAANTFVIFGVASIFYGACELINWYKFRKRIENTGL